MGVCAVFQPRFSSWCAAINIRDRLLPFLHESTWRWRFPPDLLWETLDQSIILKRSKGCQQTKLDFVLFPSHFPLYSPPSSMAAFMGTHKIVWPTETLLPLKLLCGSKGTKHQSIAQEFTRYWFSCLQGHVMCPVAHHCCSGVVWG